MVSDAKDAGAFFAPFGLGGREQKLVSLVGGGGKTTLLRALGRFLSRSGTTLLTTTTKVAPNDLPLLLLEGYEGPEEDTERIRAALRLHSPLLAAQRHVRDGDREKLEGLPPEAIDRLWSSRVIEIGRAHV